MFVLLTLAWLPGFAANAAYAQALSTVGGPSELWVVLQAEERSVAVYYRELNDPPNTIDQVVKLQGRLIPNGVAGGGSKLWLVYDDLSVQSVAVVPSSAPDMQRYVRPFIEAPLPRVAAVLAMAADEQGPWVLVRVEDQATLEQIDTQLLPSRVGQEAANPLPGVASDVQSGAMSAEASAPAPEAASVGPDEGAVAVGSRPVRELRLLRLDRNRWVRVDLPTDWPFDRRAFLVSGEKPASSPSLLALENVGDLWQLRIDTHSSNGWLSRRIKLDASPDSLIISLADYWLYAQKLPVEGTTLRVAVYAVLGDSVLRLGEASLPDAADMPWTLAAMGQTAAVIAGKGGQDLSWMRMDLTGREVEPAQKLALSPPKLGVDVIGVSIQMVMLSVALLLMFAVWKRDDGRTQITLPKDMVEADLFKRASAAVIDMLPALLLVWLFLRTPPAELIRYWPGRPISLELQFPGFVFIALYVLHTFFSELFTATTMGKRAMGLRVCSIDGTPPHLWQVLTRCLLKGFELIAWPMLILPLFRPFGQRLGDSVARTVVIMPRQEDEAGDLS